MTATVTMPNSLGLILPKSLSWGYNETSGLIEPIYSSDNALHTYDMSGFVDYANGCAVIEEQNDMDYVAASTTRTLGGTGAVGDYLRHLLIIPTNTSPDQVTIADGNGTARVVLPATAVLDDFKPIYVPIFATAKAVTTPGWIVVTGANATVLAFGRFTA